MREIVSCALYLKLIGPTNIRGNTRHNEKKEFCIRSNARLLGLT